MTKPKGDSAYSLEERGRRNYAARLAQQAIKLITEQGLVKTEEYRFFSGITLDRALAPDPCWYRDVDDVSFPVWLTEHDPTYSVYRQPIGAWADAHTQDQVLAWLTTYIADMANHKVVRSKVEAPAA